MDETEEQLGEENMNRNTILAGAAAILILVIAGSAIALNAGLHQVPVAPEERITVAYSPFESTALVWIAQDRHFFEKNGLNLTLRRYDSGMSSLDAVLNGEADLTVGVTEFPLVRKAFQKARLRAIGAIDRGYFTYLVAGKDRGIVNATDLRGKRVGTTIGTIAEFHLGRFLMLHGIRLNDIVLVDIKTPEGWVNAVADGEIDAISTAQPYANRARDRLGGNAVVMSVQSSQPLFAMAVASDTWIQEHPGTARRFLRALADAEEYAGMNPAEARSIVQRNLDLDPEYMDTVWQQNQFGIFLDQSLIVAMEDEARWMIANNMTNMTDVPDFRQYISTEALDFVKPGSVNVIR